MTILGHKKDSIGMSFGEVAFVLLVIVRLVRLKLKLRGNIV